ncbi:MAG: aldo/keto reductase [Candidatus Margulisiibacteriota bacterium]
MNKLTLGTVQFGLDYGVNNQRGKVPREEVFAILDEAAAAGVDLLDTAYGYGESETVIGEYLRFKKNYFQLVSKLPKCQVAEAPNYLAETLQRLGRTSLYGYIFHDFETYRFQPVIYDWLVEQKRSGKIAKIGFSLYYPKELDELLTNEVPFDLVQFPYSIFDRRFEDYLPTLKRKGIEVHVRSVFLQGLAFKNPAELDPSFNAIKDKITSLRSLASLNNISIQAICLNYAVLNDQVDQVIVGVDSPENLKELILAAGRSSEVAGLLPELDQLKEQNEEILLPFNWAGKKVGA